MMGSFTECTEDIEGPDFLNATNGVRGEISHSVLLRCLTWECQLNTPLDALEQIDLSLNLIDKYSDNFQFCKTADDVEEAIRDGKIASLFGLEG